VRIPNGLHIDNPAWPLLQTHISYWGITSAIGAVTGTTVVCADLANEPSYVGLQVKILDGGAAGQVRSIQTIAAGVINVVLAFTNAAGVAQQIAAGTRFVILSISGIETDVLAFGTLDTSSATVPADSLRAGVYAWENADYFKGCILMPTEGNCRYQPRPIRSYTVAGVFTLDEPFSQPPGLVDYIILASDYPVQRLLDIFNTINAMLVSTETGGSLTTDGAVQDVYINAAPAGVYEPLALKLDLTGMTAAETVIVRTLYQIRPAPAIPILEDLVTYVGVQALPLKHVALEPNRYGIQVTLQCSAGGPIDVDWEVVYRV